ncbi:hypothetical protein BDD12DRAFT_895355 [Trichophaea hybrida]|nr:hypothetical protein BDD12DRAFT_895355 [Trichophaea hybrida]
MALPPDQAQSVKDPNLDPDTILWLPATDPTHTITPVGRLNHPVLVLFTQRSNTLVCGITSFRSTSLLEKFPSQRQLNRRLQHLPLAPSDPHPDTGEILETVTTGTPYAPARGKQSYVKLRDKFSVPPGLLEHLYGGTARLTKEAMATVTRKILDSEEIDKNLTSEWRESQRQREKVLMGNYQLDTGKVGMDGSVPYDLYRENSWATYESSRIDREYTYEMPTSSSSLVEGGYVYERNYDFVPNHDRDAEEVGCNVLWRALKFIIDIPNIIRARYFL